MPRPANADADDAGGIKMGTARARGVLFAVVLGSGISFLDGLVVSVALPKMDRQLHLGVAGLQWTVSGYLLTLSALLLLAGSLGDLYGRRRTYVVGIGVFTLCSVLCGLAPNSQVLVLARIVQGVGAALMIPTSLAVIQAVFHPDDRGTAIGAWTAMSAFFTALGPFVGGVFVTYLSWRWAFFINLPLGALATWAALHYVPETRSENCGRPDVFGGFLAATGLGGVTYWAVEGPSHQSSAIPLVLGIGGIGALIMLVFVESRISNPMLPLSLFSSRQFDWVNVCTLIFYGAFGGGLTLVGIQLQNQLHYSPLEASLATLPVSILLFSLSTRFGALGQRLGPKTPMTVGPAIVAVSLAMMGAIQSGRGYWTFVLPSILMWGLGLSMTVAPLTAAALSAADQRHLGVASALNNAASRLGQSFTVALLPVLAGMGGAKSLEGPAFEEGYPRAMHMAAVLCALGAITALVFVTGRPKDVPMPNLLPES